ncbi:ubiquinone biosynthesis accessory factor UbiJ [Castellaniella sp.]|uniref:ubiquinone biosynthesis accessory factor UbiJ n=1 Tax=Castellaniella sp. TaxID=1955812 RepID=UPI003C796B00
MKLPLPSFLPPPTAVLLRGFNTLVQREPWAQERLSAHAGKSVRLSAGIWSLQLSITAQGLVQRCDPAIVPNVTLSVPAQRLKELPGAWASQGLAGVTALAHIQGDAGLAHLVSDLARDLRWDVESDLAGVVGDVMAVRLVQGSRQLVSGAKVAAGRARDNVSEYLADESGLAVRHEALGQISAGVKSLGKRLDALDQRVQRLKRHS